MPSSILHVASESVDLFGSRSRRPASVAQLAERLICNQQVAGSSPAASSRRSRMETVRRTSVFGLVRRSDAGTGRRPCLPTKPATHWARSIQHCGKKKNGALKGEKQVGKPLKEPPGTGKKKHLQPHFAKGSFPSGQRGQTVNLMAVPSQVRILYSPLHKMDAHSTEIH